MIYGDMSEYGIHDYKSPKLRECARENERLRADNAKLVAYGEELGWIHADEVERLRDMQMRATMTAFDDDHNSDMADPVFAAEYWRSRFKIVEAERDRLLAALGRAFGSGMRNDRR